MSMSSVAERDISGVEPLPHLPFRTTIAHYPSQCDDEHPCSRDKRVEPRRVSSRASNPGQRSQWAVGNLGIL